MAVHLQKLCVGAGSPDLLAARQRRLRQAQGLAWGYTLTRNRPRRSEELLAGGHIYWVMRGVFSVRQPIVEVAPVTMEDGTAKTRLGLGPTMEMVAPWPRKAFQGWRYLEEDDAPPVLASAADKEQQVLLRTLADLGLL